MHFLSKLSLMMLFTTSTGTFSPSCVSIKFTSMYDCGGKGGRGSMRLFPGLLCQLFSVVDNSTIGDKIVLKWGNFREQKNPHRSKLECLLFSIGSLNISTTLHGGDGEGKAIFPLFEVSKM